MKLYYTAGVSSLAPHIILCETGLPYSLEAVDLATHRTASGEDFFAINPKGYVPALQLDDGTLLTECPAILLYLAAQRPELGLRPPSDSLADLRLQEWLCFIGTELHKNFSPFFNPNAGADWKAAAHSRLDRQLPLVDRQLATSPYLLGEQFSIADAYLYVTLSWATWIKLDLAPYPALQAYIARIAARPAVIQARNKEGLN